MLALSAVACEHRDPPGPVASAYRTGTFTTPFVLPPIEPTASPTSSAPDPKDLEPGSDQLASIAMRTWIYDAPKARSSKLGYLRAGAVVARSKLSQGTDGCAGGWYRVAPRGFACVGKGASLDLGNPIVAAVVRGPKRGDATPYTYVMSGNPAPHLYFKLPSEEDQRRVEGPTIGRHIIERKHIFEGLTADPIPAFLAEGNRLPTPYGSDKNLAFSVHRGRAKENSAFGLSTIFDWHDRRFGLTTELDLIPLDRAKPAKVSKIHGVLLKQGGKPAFVLASGAQASRRIANQFVPAGRAEPRTGWELTGQSVGGDAGMLETTEDGLWLPAPNLTVGELREDRVKYAEKGRKWISVSIKKQLLIAYEGPKPVFAALVSTGRGGLGDPEETTSTIRGTFLIRAKHVSGTMDGDAGSDESFDLRDVPYIQYFHEGYALHAAYWHDDFGRERSHGCVNLPPADAAWLFDWTEPSVPVEWHGAVSPQGGTLVYVHP